jgi:AhpD family alkylhydroperoxidase
MPRFTPLTPETATGRAAELLGGIWDRHGSAGAMVSTMAHSPSVLGGYLDLSRATKRSALDRRISERIALAVQAWVGCEACLAAHTDAAKHLGLPDAEIELAKQGTSTDPKAAELVTFALRVLVEPATITDDDIAQLRTRCTDREILDVVAIVALQVLTGGFNLVTGLGP